jgi:nudix-type nucleoside diphosphatase (YffH/AdpP family)
MAEITQTQTVHSGWGRYLIATVQLAGGVTLRREIEDHGAAACVLPYDPARRTAVLVRQLRAPVLFLAGESETLEALAGIIEDESTGECARREAMEEAGLRLGALEPVATAWTMPGISTERMHLFLATYGEGDRIGLGGGLAHDHEGVTPVEIALDELAAMADAGQLTDLKTLTLLQTLRLRHQELFADRQAA